MTDGFIGVSLFVWAGLAAGMAAMFTVIQIPMQTSHTTGLTHIVLRWFHSVTWILLALSFLVRGAAPRLWSLVSGPVCARVCDCAMGPPS